MVTLRVPYPIATQILTVFMNLLDGPTVSAGAATTIPTGWELRTFMERGNGLIHARTLRKFVTAKVEPMTLISLAS